MVPAFDPMKFARLLTFGGLVAALPLRAVYAPLPEQNLGKEWTVALRVGVSHDSNIFGAQSGAIGSMVYEASPRIGFAGSLSDQTFAECAYELTVDHYADRPGEKTLDSHEFSARLAHAFNSTTNVDLSDQYDIAKNPESLLAGLPVNTDQSYKRNQLDARFAASPVPKFGAVVKFRSVNFDYDNATLADSLNRTENLYGLEGTYEVVPEMKAVAEYRHEDINYQTDGSTKDKNTDFAMGGVDYAVAKKFSFSGRLGGEWRNRSSEANTTAPYAEFSAKYDYAERSFLAAGYVYTFEETSNIAKYDDTHVNRFFVNLQHAFSALIVGSASVTYEPSLLIGRRGISGDVNETTVRVGLALTWLPTEHWAVSASYDRDDVNSDDPARGQERDRVGVSAGYTF